MNYLSSRAHPTCISDWGSAACSSDLAPTPTYLGGNFTVSATTTNTDSAGLTYSVVSGPCALGSEERRVGKGCRGVRADSAAKTNYLASSAKETVTNQKARSTVTFGAA